MTNPENTSPAGTPPPTDGPQVSDRRHFVRAGLGAIPVVMTLVSRPVLGQQVQCFAPSAFVSGNQSIPNAATCAGAGPGFWRNSVHFSSWPSGVYPIDQPNNGPKATTFCSVFACMAGVYSPTTTLLQVVNGSVGAGPPDDVGGHIVAAYLNLLAGLVPPSVLSLMTIRDIWQQYISTGGGTVGYYNPLGATGPKWFHNDIVSYLMTTMPA